MLRKAKGKGYTLSLHLDEPEYRKIALWIAVAGERSDDQLKSIVLNALKLSDAQQAAVKELMK